MLIFSLYNNLDNTYTICYHLGMFKPKYDITEYFLSLIEKAGKLSAKIEETGVRLPVLAGLQKEALDRNVHASTSIEGNVLNLAQVAALNDKRGVTAAARQKLEVENYTAAMRWILGNCKEAITIERIFKLHETIGRDLLSADKTGVFKSKQNYVVDGNNLIVYAPPEPHDCPHMMDELLTWINSKEQVHPVIRSAIAHHQFVSIHPFSDGNGRMARVLAQWILYSNDFDPHHVIALDEFYAADRQRYYDKIQQTRELDYDFTFWIEYVAEGVVSTMETVYARLSAFSTNSSEPVNLTPRQEILIGLLRDHGQLDSNRLCELMNINRARVNQLIGPLVKAGIVTQQGKTRGTRYYLKRNL